MKNLLFAFFFIAAGIRLSAQTSVPRYVLIEHFTNSRCSVCASKNPAFYDLIAQYPNQVHHIAVHPSVPYSSCVFYQANTTDNNARAAVYDIQFTPQVALNGDHIPVGTPLLPLAKLTEKLNQTSPIAVQVTENNGTAVVTVRSYGTPPTGDYKLFAVLVEKEINQITSNGEGVHHDVLRDILTNTNGDPIALPAAGAALSFTFSTLSSNSSWNPDQLYVLAWLQNTQDKTVLNSGTKFDPLLVAANEPIAQQLTLSPNPAVGFTRAVLSDDTAVQVAVYALDGRLVSTLFSTNNNVVDIPTEMLSTGVYTVKIMGSKGLYIGKMVK